MAERQQVNRSTTARDEQEVQPLPSAQTDDGFDALLDEIDGLLETDAAEYVRSFVQKGGQ